MDLYALPPVGALRRELQNRTRMLISGREEPPVPTATVDDPGLFGPDSVTWLVHADEALFVGGIRALFLQALHPGTMAGVAEHSDYKVDPLGRLQRTGEFLGRTTYGSTADAEQSIAIVRSIHDRVHGVTPEGEPYDANDPHLLSWVHITEVDSFLRAHQRYGNVSLSDDQADQYVEEMAVIADRLGVDDPPTNRAELRDQLFAFRPELHAGDQARDAVRWLIVPPLPLAARAPYALLASAAIAMLPRHARYLLRLPLAPGFDPLVVRPATTAMLRVINWAMSAPDRPRLAS